MRLARLGVALVVAFGAFAFRQDAVPEESLWLPEGYKLLSPEERQALTSEEMRELGTRNSELLKAAVGAMSVPERQEVAEALTRYVAAHSPPDHVKQYVTMAHMLILSSAIQEKVSADRAVVEKKFAELLRAQEDTKGFPPEREPVEKESRAIEKRLRQEDAWQLYLRVLRPLRARPWNQEARIVFRKIVRSDSYDRPQKTSLYDAALVFVQNREKETPEQGAWYSLEAFLRLSMRGEVPEAKRLFGMAIARNANDIESRTFPLLLAAADGNAAEFDRLLPRARESWPKAGQLEQVLWEDIHSLPVSLQPRARKVLGEKFKKVRPADWETREEILAAAILRNEFREVEAETATLLVLPPATLPEPHRSELSALGLRAAAGLGRCDEVVAALPRLEAAARAAYPYGRDFGDPPPARTREDVRNLRATLAEGRRELETLRASMADGSYAKMPELSELPSERRHAAIEAAADELAQGIVEMEEFLADGDDAAVAEAWTRRDLDGWTQAQGYPENARFDGADRGFRLAIHVRAAAGRCLLAKGRAAEAVPVLAPCVGKGLVFHSDCGEPMLEAGEALVRQGRWADVAAVYAATAPVENFARRAEDLYLEVERASPGSVPRFQPTATPAPLRTPTPFAPPVP